ncbi:hypothetical protein CRUP_001195 [Coryphaenoides rupestris]|nr:hypothetical protein CRUP_001195 [Coryphaenoides rupestris]
MNLSTCLSTYLSVSLPVCLSVCHGAQGRYAQKLLSDLMENYSNALRPVEDTDKTLNVTLQITLSQIKDMDERNQVLTTYLWIRQIWHDAYLKADEESSGQADTNVVLRYNGEITWDSPAITKSSCVVDVDICMGTDSGDLSDFVENVEWECHGMPAVRNVIMYGCCSDPYPDITYTLLLKRRSSFYIFNLLLPCFLISFLAPLGFYLPADSGEKVSLGVTVLLALTVFQLMVAESMPPSESVPYIGKYYIATMTMITASTSLTIFIMNIHFCGAEAKPVPHWAKVVIIDYMSKILFVYEVGENCTTPESERTPLYTDEPMGEERYGRHDDETYRRSNGHAAKKHSNHQPNGHYCQGQQQQHQQQTQHHHYNNHNNHHHATRGRSEESRGSPRGTTTATTTSGGTRWTTRARPGPCSTSST